MGLTPSSSKRQHDLSQSICFNSKPMHSTLSLQCHTAHTLYIFYPNFANYIKQSMSILVNIQIKVEATPR